MYLGIRYMGQSRAKQTMYIALVRVVALAALMLSRQATALRPLIRDPLVAHVVILALALGGEHDRVSNTRS